MDNHLDLAKKLNELAKRGEGGEKINAQKLLAKFCAKHGINIDEVDDEKTQSFTVKIPDELQWLYFRTVGQVTQKDNNVWNQRKRNHFRIECTESEFVLINSIYDHYKKELGKQLELLKTAFIIKHRIWMDGNSTGKPPSAEEQERINKAFRMAENMETESYQKRLK